MRLLWVATKPPWPARDGGRLLLAETLRALAQHGHELHVVAPADPGIARSPPWPDGCVPHLVAAPAPSLARMVPALLRGRPLTIVRHTRAAVRDAVARLVATTSFEVVHAEQLHAVPQCRPARARGIPLVLRAQNVETDLWAGVAAGGGWRGALAARERTRIAAYEAATVRGAAATIALTERDATRLRALGGSAAVVHAVAAPFAADGLGAGPPLPGAPAVVLLASADWLPSADGARWFLDHAWTAVRARLPEARLHVFGFDRAARARRSAARGHVDERGIVFHPPPATSATAFAEGAALVVPLRIASGVRMKILEAWARGLPVVATPEASAGLDAEPGRELLVARDGEAFAAALASLATDAGTRTALVRSARAFLRARHDPAAIAAQLTSIAADAASAARARR